MLVVMMSLVSNMFVPGNISGTVFLDFNSNGVQDPANVSSNEVGFGGITVTAYDNSNAAIATTATAADGTYSLAVELPVRIEFTDVPANMSSSFQGSGSATSVQFYTSSTSTANFAIIDRSQYSQPTPSVITTAMSNGALGASSTVSALYEINNGSNLSTLTSLRPKSALGSVWGVAYDRRNGIVYTSAFLKRHADFGPQGIAGLYWGTRSGAALINNGSADLNSLTSNSFGLNPRTDGVGPDDNLTGVTANSASRDRDAYEFVGKRGIGGIDISADGKTLYVVNLTTRRLEAFNVSAVAGGGAPTYIGSYTITDPGCSGGDFRPFAVKVAGPDLVYVGVTCTAETSGNRIDLLGYVAKIVPSAGFAAASTLVPIQDNDLALPTTSRYTANTPQPAAAPPANAIPLYYNRGQSNTANSTANYHFKPWTDTWPTPASGQFMSAPQPLLSSIEINRSGDLVFGIMDRMGHRTGFQNYDNSESGTTLYYYFAFGDILYTKNTGTLNNPVYYLEGTTQNPATHNNTGSLANTTYLQGPGGNEYFDDYTSNGPHFENTLGGVTILPNENLALSTVMDAEGPGGATFSNGVSAWDVSDGNFLRSITAFITSSSATFGKAAGMGDLEILADVAPIQVGNRIWMDVDRDGIQDAAETTPGVPAGTTVTLSSPGPDGDFSTTGDNQTWTTTTDANGNYYFDALSSRDARSPAGITANVVLPGFDYRISVAVPTGFNLTTQDAGGANQRDSDAALSGLNAVIAFNTEVTDHTYDIGFYDPTVLPVKLVSFVGKLTREESVRLDWITTEEENNSYFDIQRSSDPVNFKTIGRVKGNGSTASRINYTFADTQPLANLNYYRLKQVDLDGKYSYSRIITVALPSKSTLNLYPIPVNDGQLTVDSGAETIVSYQVYNLTGAKVFEKTKVNGKILNVRGLLPGVYLLKTTNAQGVISTNKFIVK